METNLSLLETFDRLERNDGTSALELGMYCAFFAQSVKQIRRFQRVKNRRFAPAFGRT